MILKFSSNYCQPCKLLSATLKKIGLEVEEVDIDEKPELVAKYNVRGVPTMVYLHDDLVFGTLVGNKSEKDIMSWVEQCKVDSQA